MLETVDSLRFETLRLKVYLLEETDKLIFRL